MKKIFTLAAAFMATALSFQAAADSWVVTTSAEFTTALSSLGRKIGARDTIFVKPESADVVISSGTYKTVPTAGKFWVIGVPTDFKPILQLRFDAESGTEEGSDLSMIFENVHIQFTGGNTPTSGQIFYWNGKYADMDTVAFRNCEISNYPRTIWRTVPPKHKEVIDGVEKDVYDKAGTVMYFEMSDCIVHNANLTSNNGWPAIYFGQVPIEIVFKNNTFYVVQSYGVPLRQLTDEDFSIARNSTIFFGYSFLYSRFYKRYTDTKAESGDFYENWYVSPERSYDSIFESLLSNRLFVQIQPWDRDGAVGVINAGIGNDAHHYYQFRLQDYMGSNEGVNRNSTYVYGSIEGNVKRYLDWNADVKFHLFGYRRQDLSVGGDVAFKVYVRGRPMTLKGSLRHEIRTPGYWTESYFSNHFVWSNSFSKESETRFSVTFSAPQIGLELGGYQSLLGDRIYYGADQLPAQYGGTVTVSGLYAQKDFRFGGLHLNHRVLYQYSSAEEVVPVPAISAYLSYYFEFNVVKNVLRLQLGLDGRYNTSYYAFGYNPATAQFYNQREKKLGNYPMIDVFAAAKWKRMRILIKMQHLNENMFGDRNYFTVLHYPQNPRMFKLGVSWSFYD